MTIHRVLATSALAGLLVAACATSTSLGDSSDQAVRTTSASAASADDETTRPTTADDTGGFVGTWATDSLVNLDGTTTTRDDLRPVGLDATFTIRDDGTFAITAAGRRR